MFGMSPSIGMPDTGRHACYMVINHPNRIDYLSDPPEYRHVPVFFDTKVFDPWNAAIPDGAQNGPIENYVDHLRPAGWAWRFPISGVWWMMSRVVPQMSNGMACIYHAVNNESVTSNVHAPYWTNNKIVSQQHSLLMVNAGDFASVIVLHRNAAPFTETTMSLAPSPVGHYVAFALMAVRK